VYNIHFGPHVDHIGVTKIKRSAYYKV